MTSKKITEKKPIMSNKREKIHIVVSILLSCIPIKEM